MKNTNPIPKIAQVALTGAFGAVTALALWQHGYWGILLPHFQSWGAAQVFMDLVIALGMVLVWMWHDARANARRFWPWALFTLVAGSFGPLIYLVTRPQAK